MLTGTCISNAGVQQASLAAEQQFLTQIWAVSDDTGHVGFASDM
jgi:hypothetical protein